MDDNKKPTGPRGPMAGSTQGATTPKKKHSLNRETQIKLGTQLQNMYNAYLNEGTPDRFRSLLHKLEAGEMPGISGGLPFEGVKDASDNKES
jgi:hypothetical protein